MRTRPPRSVAALALSIQLLSLPLACAGESPSGLSEAEKRQRIAAMYEEYREEFPAVDSISAEELAGLLESAAPPVLVDARSEEERAVSTIPGAISRQEFERLREELAAREVVTYCTIGYRSGLYTEELVEQGWEARNLAGSILAWTHRGLPLVRPDGTPTRRVHVYGARWNLAAEEYEAVW